MHCSQCKKSTRLKDIEHNYYGSYSKIKYECPICGCEDEYVLFDSDLDRFLVNFDEVINKLSK